MVGLLPIKWRQNINFQEQMTFLLVNLTNALPQVTTQAPRKRQLKVPLSAVKRQSRSLSLCLLLREVRNQFLYISQLYLRQLL